MKNLNLKNKIAIIFLLILIIMFFVLNQLNKIASPILLQEAVKESYNFITKTVNTSVKTVVTEKLNPDELFIMTYDKSGSLVSIDFDPTTVNIVLSTIALEIEQNINNLPSKAYSIPFGIVLRNAFLSNLGPNIPVKLKLVGSIVNNVSTKVTNYGINNALIELYVDIEINVHVVLPFISDDIKVLTSVPLALKLVRGNVPKYYAGNSNSLLSVPIE